MSNLKEEYKKEVIPKLQKQFAYKNQHQIPKLVKIQISAGLGLNAQNKNYLQAAIEEVRLISGQQPILTKAKKSIAAFKVRQGMPVGLTVTLRREKMYAFFEKFIKLVLPRIRDFRGLSPSHFDDYGNYNLGLSDQLVFPEIDYDSVQQKRGFTITIVSTAKNKKEGLFLLSELGLPFSQLDEEGEK
jgi:large subunit ribosomal protein L5